MKGVSNAASESARPDRISSASLFAAFDMSVPRSNARNRSRVLTLTKVPGISSLPDAATSRARAASSDSSPVPNARASSWHGDDTTAFCAGV